MRLYGDENFSGFFRRLSFSPDGALLVTPTGIFESSNTAALHQMQSPASPTLAHQSVRRSSEQEDFRGSPASPLLSHGSIAAPSAPPRSTVYLYGRGNLHKSNAPIAHLPGHKTASLVIKFSPILYELRRGTRWNKTDETDGIAPHPNVPLEVGKQKTVSLGSTAGALASSSAIQEDINVGEGQPKTTRSYSATSSTSSSPTKSMGTSSTPPASSLVQSSMIGLPYRMIFAVATHDSVWIYDTQQGGPLCCFSNMHYASFTDLTWSSDGQTLMMCSTDGYCSVVVFDYGELGVPYQYQNQPSLQTMPGVSGNTAGSVKPGSVVDSPKMVRRESGQGISLSLSNQGQDGGATPSTKAYTSSQQADASPTLGLGLATGSGDSDMVGEEETEQEQSAAVDENPGAKKRRRIAPTLQGPIGS